MPTQGEILRDLRLERKMTMQELADQLKVSKQTIIRMVIPVKLPLRNILLL